MRPSSWHARTPRYALSRRLGARRGQYYKIYLSHTGAAVTAVSNRIFLCTSVKKYLPPRSFGVRFCLFCHRGAEAHNRKDVFAKQHCFTIRVAVTVLG